jgi:hypothetical protein
MTKRTSRLAIAFLALVVPAAVLIAPPATVAKKSKRVKIYLEGPINHSKDPGYTPYSHNCCFPSYVPTIQIKAKFGGSKKPSVKVTQFGLWGPCSGAEYSDGESKDEMTLKPKKNRSFAGTHTDEFGTIFTVAGQIRRNGTASGTVRQVENRGPPSNEHAYGICDSGTVTWTASRVPALTDLHASFNPNLVYPEGL